MSLDIDYLCDRCGDSVKFKRNYMILVYTRGHRDENGRNPVEGKAYICEECFRKLCVFINGSEYEGGKDA